MHKTDNSTAGFTLVEILIVMVIIGILAGIGSSILTRALPGLRLKSAARDIFSIALQAKAQAVELAIPVGVKFDDDDNVCILFRDDDNDAAPAAAEEIRRLPLPEGVHFGGITFNNDALVFSPRGIPLQTGGGLGIGSVTLEGSDSQGNTIETTRTISLSSAGRVSITVN